MIRKKDINGINSKLDSITGAMSKKAEAYDKEHKYLKDVKINIDKAYAFFDEKTLRYVVKIDYNVMPTTLYIDDDGEAIVNNRFRAMNELNLIPLEDLQKVSKAISNAAKLNKGGDKR